jgi:RNase P/RNase MRP subunit POP5
MVKTFNKRYIALEVPEGINRAELASALNLSLNEFFGTSRPIFIRRVKIIEVKGRLAIVLFMLKREFDVGPLLAALTLLNLKGSWSAPLLTSGTLKRLKQSLKERYEELIKG